ncbi:MAG: exo-alpha-sialidase [Chloroflexales bacterium]|nr:exo-alpha-sialidase [Chloroflexales bacterium]
MLRKIIVALSSLAILAATLAAPEVKQAQAQTDSGLRLVNEFQVSGSNDVKYPDVVAANRQVHMSGNANRSSAYLWSKAITATSFDSQVELGPASGQPDFSSTGNARGPDGSIYVTWVNQGSRTVYMRQRNTAGVWGPTRTVNRSSIFPVTPEISVSTRGTIFVAWRDPGRPIHFSTSTDGGANWAGARDVSDSIAFASLISLASGPDDAMGITFTASEGDSLHIFAGLWNVSSFNVQRVTSLGSDYADSSISIGPDGKVYVAWRGVADSGGNSGVFYSERAANGSWPRSRLAGGKVLGEVTVSADESGSLHFTWIAQPSGSNQINYAFKPFNGLPLGPVASGSTGALFNARGFGNVSDGSYNHVVTEEFTGSRVHTRYSLFQSSVVVFGGDPVVENGASRARTSAGNTVQVTFPNVVGSPNQIRYAWNRVPTNSDAWLPFTSPMLLEVPEDIINSSTCGISTLYTQLRNTTTNQVEAQPRSDTVQIDSRVAASVQIDNALNHVASGVAELSNIQGAPGGDPSYTRVPLVYLSVTPQGDCSGLASLGVGSTPTTAENTYTLSSSGFQGVVPLPNLANLAPGKTTFYVQITDGTGNVRVYPFDVIIDEDAPVLNTSSPGTVTPVADAAGDVLQDLTFTNINVRDNTYDPEDPDPNRHIWGVWIANSTDRVADPLAAGLKWVVVKAPASVAVPNAASGGTDYQFTIQNWSLATGLSTAQLTAGDYFIYIRFLDAAGNPTDVMPPVVIPASQMNRVESQLPALSR